MNRKISQAINIIIDVRRKETKLKNKYSIKRVDENYSLVQIEVHEHLQGIIFLTYIFGNLISSN